MNNSSIKKNAYLLLIALVLLIGGTYAWFTLTINNSKTNIIRAGKLKINLVDCEKDLVLKNAVPVSDNKGMQSEVCTFKVENTGTTSIDYSVYLDDTDKEDISNEKRMKDKYVKYWLTKNDIVRSQGMGTVKFVEGGYTGIFDPSSHKFVHVVNSSGSEQTDILSGVNSKLSDNATFSDGVEAFKSMFGTNHLTYETQEPADAKILGTKVIGIGTIKFVEGNYTATFDTSTHKFTSIVDSSGSEQTNMLSGANAKLSENATFDDAVEVFKSFFGSSYTFEITEPIDPVALNSREIDTATIKGNQTDTYKLRVWIDQDADNGVMGTIFAGKIRIEATQTKPAVANLKAIDKTQTISGVVFNVVNDEPTTTSNINKNAKVKMLDNKKDAEIEKVASMKSQAAYSYDVSVEQDKSVMQYNVLNSDKTTYTAYIEAKTKITAPEDSSNLLAISSATSITGLENLDTSKVTNMKSLFSGVQVTSLDLSSWDTSNVTNMSYMFNEASNLNSIDVSNLNTSKVTNMSMMFAYTSSLNDINVSNFKTSNVTNMFRMFSASAISSIDISNFDMSSATTISQMFAETTNIEVLDMSSLNLSKVTQAELLINKSNIKELDLTNANFDSLDSSNFQIMFIGAENLEVLNANNMSMNTITSITGGYNGVLKDCTKIRYVNMNHLDAPNLTLLGSILPWYSGSENTNTQTELVDLSYMNAPKLENINKTFQYSNVKNVNLSNINSNSLTSLYYAFANTPYLENVNLEGTDTSKVENINYLFSESAIPSFDFTQLDTSSVTSFTYFLYGTTKLLSADLSSFDLSNAIGNYMFSNSSIENLDMNGVTAKQLYFSDLPSRIKKLNFSNMDIKSTDGSWSFNTKTKLEEIDLSNTTINDLRQISFAGHLNVKSINMENLSAPDCLSISTIFAGTTGLTDLNISGLSMPKLKDMSDAFNSSGITGSLNLSNFNTPEIEVASNAFKNTKLSNINLSGWTAPILNKFDTAFANSTSLETVNLENADLSGLTSMSKLFYGDSALTEINVSGIKTGSLSDISQMFDGTTSLASINLKDLDLSTVTNMIGIINNSGITSINLDNADMSSLETLNRAFYGANKLKTFSMKNAKVSNITDVREMFSIDSLLTTVDMSGTVMNNIAHADNWFKDCTALKAIDISGVALSTDLVGDEEQSNGYLFENVPSGINVKVKDEAGKKFIEDQFGFCNITGTATIA